ncbi:MAG TPA: SPFH domain-containing protein [Clostridia bacterium]|nr:SPFH domain-containing protein [Clostridia bacterium]
MRVQFETNFERFLKRVTLSFRWIILASLVLLAASGIFWVESDEVAMILRMGRLVGNTPSEQLLRPGLHFAFPYIIDEVVKVSVGRIRELEVSAYASADGLVSNDVTQSGYLISGDHNIVMLKAVVKYQIADPIQFVWVNGDPEKLITTVVGGELLHHSSSMEVDSLLTSSKGLLADLTRKTSQTLLDGARCGVTLTNVELTSMRRSTRPRFKGRP